MKYETFAVTVSEAGIAEIRFNRADRLNVMNTAYWREVREVFQELDHSGDVRVAVMSAEGRHFSAGMDLDFFELAQPKEGEDPGRARERLRRLILLLQDSFNAIERARFPVIAATQGACIGGAFDMITACDLRIASRDAYFIIQEINIGMTADCGTLQRLPKLIPDALARELAYTGRKFFADEALSRGLLNGVGETSEQARDQAWEMAKVIAAKSPLAIAGTKRALDFGRNHSVSEGLGFMANWNAGMFMTEDVEEAVAAQKEKREANFSSLPGPIEGL